MENTSFDHRPEAATPVSVIKQELDKLGKISPEGVNELVQEEKEDALERWQANRNRTDQLFEQLNGDKEGFGRDYFEVKVKSEEKDGVTVDTYIRVTNFRQWMVKDGTYNFHYIKRKSDGTADYSDRSWGLGRKFTYQYGELNKRTVDLEVTGEGKDKDIEFVRYDGRPIGEPQPADTAILIAALREEVEPRLTKTEEALELISKALDPKAKLKVAEAA